MALVILSEQQASDIQSYYDHGTNPDVEKMMQDYTCQSCVLHRCSDGFVLRKEPGRTVGCLQLTRSTTNGKPIAKLYVLPKPRVSETVQSVAETLRRFLPQWKQLQNSTPLTSNGILFRICNSNSEIRRVLYTSLDPIHYSDDLQIHGQCFDDKVVVTITSKIGDCELVAPTRAYGYIQQTVPRGVWLHGARSIVQNLHSVNPVYINRQVSPIHKSVFDLPSALGLSLIHI